MKSIRPILLTVCALLALNPLTAGQVPPGDAAQFTSGGSAQSGLNIIDANGSGNRVPIGGVFADNAHLRDGVIDPVNGLIWCVGGSASGAAPKKLIRFKLTGTEVAAQEAIADFDPLSASALTAVDLGRDGNAFVCSSNQLWMVERHGHSILPWASNAFAGEWSSLTIDRVTNRMWIVEFGARANSRVIEFDLDLGPSPGQVVLDASSPMQPLQMTSITHGDDGRLYIGTLDGAYSYDPDSGAVELLPTQVVLNSASGATNEFNSLDFDSGSGLLHTGGGLTGNGSYHVIDLNAFSSSLLNSDYTCDAADRGGSDACAQVSSVRAISVNDYLHTTQMFPRQASSAAGFTLEISAQGAAGNLGAVVLTEANGIPLAPTIIRGIGVCGPGGTLTRSFTLGPGQLNAAFTSIGFNSFSYDWIAGVLTIGGQVELSLVP